MRGPGAKEPGAAQQDDDYEPPRIEVLGTLADLTRGGTSGPDDGFGGAGASGII